LASAQEAKYTELEDNWVSRKYTSEKLTNSIRMDKKVEAIFKDLEIIES